MTSLKMGMPVNDQAKYVRRITREPVRVDLPIEVPVPWPPNTVMLAIYEFNVFSFLWKHTESFSLQCPFPMGQAQRFFYENYPEQRPGPEIKQGRPQSLLGYPIDYVNDPDWLKPATDLPEAPAEGEQPEMPKMETINVLVNIRFDEETTNEVCLAYVISELLNDDNYEQIPEWEGFCPDIELSVVTLSKYLTNSIITKHNDADSPIARTRREHIKKMRQMNIRPGFFTDIKWQLFACAVVQHLCNQDKLENGVVRPVASGAKQHIEQLKQHKISALLAEAERYDAAIMAGEEVEIELPKELFTPSERNDQDGTQEKSRAPEPRVAPGSGPDSTE